MHNQRANKHTSSSFDKRVEHQQSSSSLLCFSESICVNLLSEPFPLLFARAKGSVSEISDKSKLVDDEDEEVEDDIDTCVGDGGRMIMG